ncbi:MAG TPA: hypothetical protein VMW72_12075 [Sedimentisphaerales bacterium]|nr:hypothetical protein [Sedimentisphaerales bacterium]
MNWGQAKNVITTTQSLVTSIALIIGAIWAYYRFIRFRTLKPRMEFSFDFNRFSSDHDSSVAIVKFKVCNKGNTKVDLRNDMKHRCFLKYGLIETNGSVKRVSIISKSSKQLKYIDKVFIAHGWIEPNETLDDVKIINVPTKKNTVIQLELEIFGQYKWIFREHKTKWSASTAFPLISDVTTSSFTSEDEQDEYEETEWVIAAMETNMNRAEAMLESSSLPENHRVRNLRL